MDAVDVAVVGGGPAGLSAALILGRARVRTLVIDGGEGRNAASHAAHSIFARDGMHPAELRRLGVEQLKPYGVTVLGSRGVSRVERTETGFALTLDDARTVLARKVILATGVRDVLPDIPGFREWFGRRIFHCPYCDGWEQRDQPLALMLPNETADEAIRLFRSWSHRLTLLPFPGETLSDASVRLAREIGALVRPSPLTGVEAVGEGLRLVLEDGSDLAVRALFTRPDQEPRNELARQLGCDLVPDKPVPGMVVVDRLGQTSVPGVYAAGDLATVPHQAWIAATSGGMAGIAAHRDLIAEGFPFTS